MLFFSHVVIPLQPRFWYPVRLVLTLRKKRKRRGVYPLEKRHADNQDESIFYKKWNITFQNGSDSPPVFGLWTEPAGPRRTFGIVRDLRPIVLSCGHSAEEVWFFGNGLSCFRHRMQAGTGSYASLLYSLSIMYKS